MRTNELFWIILGLSFPCFIFTCLYIQDIAWFFFMDWGIIAITYVAYKYYRWQFIKLSKKYGYYAPVYGKEAWDTICSIYEVRT